MSAVSLSLLLTPWSASAGQACIKQSPPHTVALLELYTSEGCSSCPPADHFISGLNEAGLGADRVVPLSLHVDYWDYIGWKDAFARPLFTERQYWLSAQGRSRTVYTPEIFVAGQELRNWRLATPAAVRRINEQPAQAQIALSAGMPSNGSLPVEVKAKASRDAALYVVLYQSGLSTEVKAGENRGVQLRHDYVVRDWIGPLALDAQGGPASLPRALAVPAGAMAQDLGVAAFVQTPRGEVLQALALPLCSG
ncbi:hypothetical protein AYR66_27290 [Noviherbaspirillum denitrificans]|uniref:DUF1223 domain-containing protein n=1 Tax=Noviherbaspirillum denitrificans TaxID=1968433 RepID=A0A254TKK3_9BURK|nr:hypothetical protein AYR66_27290 [Noviherbaspirillum denitrificans]